ncbi:MAG: hypothetical protein IIT72_03450, partial [Lachnospiraceae bacterium]|nr:hypothetical protein [Lachnospiraceae bacterium]
MDQSQQVVMARQMPSSLEAEQAVIGSMLLDQDAVNTAAEQLIAEDFYYPAYAVMYTTIVDLYNESRVVDAVAVTEKLKTAGLAAEYTEPRFIAELMNSVPTSANIGQYCNIVKEKAMLRCPMTDKARARLKAVFEKLGLSARAYDRLLKVARTAA